MSEDLNRRAPRRWRDVVWLPVRMLVLLLLLVFAPVMLVLAVLASVSESVNEWAEGFVRRWGRMVREWRFMASSECYEKLLEQERRINVLTADQKAREARLERVMEVAVRARDEARDLREQLVKAKVEEVGRENPELGETLLNLNRLPEAVRREVMKRFARIVEGKEAGDE